MSVLADIVRVLRDRLLSTPSVCPVAWENVRFTPPVSGVWGEETILAIDTEQAGCGSLLQRTTLTWGVRLFIAADTGIDAALAQASAMQTALRALPAMRLGGNALRVLRCAVSGPTNNAPATASATVTCTVSVDHPN